MSGSLNKVMLIGHLGADPEIRSLNSGDRVANLRIATSETWKDRNSGERKEKTEWHRVTVFNEHIVKVCENYLRKGAKVYIEGALQTRKYQDQSGSDRYATEIVLQKFRGELTMLSSVGDREDDDGDQDRRDDRRDHGRDDRSSYGGGGGYSGQTRGGYSDQRPREDFSANLDDEIPFASNWGLR